MPHSVCNCMYIYIHIYIYIYVYIYIYISTRYNIWGAHSFHNITRWACANMPHRSTGVMRRQAPHIDMRRTLQSDYEIRCICLYRPRFSQSWLVCKPTTLLSVCVTHPRYSVFYMRDHARSTSPTYITHVNECDPVRDKLISSEHARMTSPTCSIQLHTNRQHQAGMHASRHTIHHVFIHPSSSSIHPSCNAG